MHQAGRCEGGGGGQGGQRCLGGHGGGHQRGRVGDRAGGVDGHVGGDQGAQGQAGVLLTPRNILTVSEKPYSTKIIISGLLNFFYKYCNKMVLINTGVFFVTIRQILFVFRKFEKKFESLFYV